MTDSNNAITQLLEQFSKGERGAVDELIPLVYAKLRRIANSQLKSQRSGHTLAPTALVHEAFVRLMNNEELALRDRRHFFAVAARCMRWILMDYARQRQAERRGGNPIRVSFDERIHIASEESVDLGILNTALEKLSRQDAMLIQIVEMRYLAGMSIEETAAALEISTGTVKRRWSMAKAWLHREITKARD